MTERTLALGDLAGRPATELVEQVARRREVLTVVLAGGETVEIRPGAPLKPLPELQGSVPQGWKDAVYGP